MSILVNKDSLTNLADSIRKFRGINTKLSFPTGFTSNIVNLTNDYLSGRLSIYSSTNVCQIRSRAFRSVKRLQLVDLASVKHIGNEAFYGCSNLLTIIIRSENVCTLESSNAFTYTPITSTGYIYVPRDLVDSYKTAANWSTYANRFRAIEDYPEICGTEG